MQAASTNTSLQMLTLLHLYRFKYSHRFKYLNSPHLWPTDKASLILDVVMFGVQILGSAHQDRNI